MASKCCCSYSYFSSIFFLRPNPNPNPTRLLLNLPLPLRNHKCRIPSSLSSPLTKSPFSTATTPHPLQYDMIISRPDPPHHRLPRRLTPSPSSPHPNPNPDSDSEPPQSVADLSFEDWVDKKLTHKQQQQSSSDPSLAPAMDKSMKKYYNKRRRRMYGSDSDDEARKQHKHELVELKPQVVELRTLHKREEELYFYDTFALPWEKDKHYKMVYQLEKKYFPDQCLDNAFLEPGQSNNPNTNMNKKNKMKNTTTKGENQGKEENEEKGLVFFEDKTTQGLEENKDMDISHKKVQDFFKVLKKKIPINSNNNNDVTSNVVDHFLASPSTGLPPQWDSPLGTVVLLNKPKGWTSFTVCGKLRRLTKVKKVGHAGTLDPMATGLLIVCVGKATKLVDRYQGMIKSYSGVFRLGEATSTWDADSPVILREPWDHIKDEDIKKAVASFTGEIWQVPPMFSAIKVGGERLYEKARRGENIELSPRRISIYQFDIERSLEDRQNLIFRVICSKGTYIRSLCADLGKSLGSCAHLTALRRDSIGEYSVENAFDFQDLGEQITKGYL